MFSFFIVMLVISVALLVFCSGVSLGIRWAEHRFRTSQDATAGVYLLPPLYVPPFEVPCPSFSESPLVSCGFGGFCEADKPCGLSRRFVGSEVMGKAPWEKQ